MVKAVKRYASIFKGVKLPWIGLLCLLAVRVFDTVVGVETVTLTASIIDATQNTIKTETLVRYAVFMLATGGLAMAENFFTEYSTLKIDCGVRVKMWNKLMRLPSRYYDGENGNELVSRVTRDSAAASSYFTLAINCFTTVYGAVYVFRRLFSFEPTLAAWLLLIIPCTIGVGAVYSVVGYKAGVATNKTFSATTGYLTERVHNLRLIKAFVTEKREIAVSKERFRRQYGAELVMELTVAIMQMGVQILSCVGLAVSFLVGGTMVANGTLTVGKLIAFYTLSGMVGMNMANLFMAGGAVFEVNGLVKRISHILDVEDESTEGQTFEDEDDLKFENVSFSYGDVPVLQGVSCTIRRGRVTAIIGTNGAGKSTLLKLLERMYQPTGGTIMVGGANVEEYSIPSWRRSFALVAQDSPLMDGTVRENMLYGVEREVSDEELIEAAKLANAYDFIMATPGGFDEPVGPGGTNFSGGQRQCIAIARAVMRRAKYLLLDEATSNLDAVCESMVTSALDRLMEGKTTIMIAHSYRATQLADDIIIMKDGVVAEAGTPEELLKNSEYYRMFARQTSKGEIV